MFHTLSGYIHCRGPVFESVLETCQSVCRSAGVEMRCTASFRGGADTCEADIGHGANCTNGMRSWKKNCNVLPKRAVMEKLQALTTIRIVTLYERIGGEQTVDRLVESFYSRMDSLADAKTVRAMHGPDLAPTKAILK